LQVRGKRNGQSKQQSDPTPAGNAIESQATQPDNPGRNMVKPGKKKVVEELSRKKLESRKNGTAPESDNEEKDIAGSNGDTGSSVSHSTAASTSKKPPNKRKARPSTTVRSESEDSDDLPLNSNGNKVSTSTSSAAAGGPSAPKKRNLGKPKANPAPAAKNGNPEHF